MKTLELVERINSIGKGTQRAIYFASKTLIVPVDGKLNFFEDNKHHKQMSVPNTAVYYVDWAIPNKRVWVCGDSGIKNLYIHDNNNNNDDDDKENYEISFHQMTCCGVDYDHNNGIVAVGDFAGSVYLWKEGQSHPFRQTQLVTYAAVRFVFFYIKLN